MEESAWADFQEKLMMCLSGSYRAKKNRLKLWKTLSITDKIPFLYKFYAVFKTLH